MKKMKKVQVLTLQSPQECQALWEISTQLFVDIPTPVVSQTADALLDNLAGYLRRCHVFIITAEPTQFLALKAKLLKGLGCTPYVRSHVLAQQSQPCREDAAFPVGAQAFLSDDGLFNGFALHCGKQDMLFLPLDLALLEQQRGQVFDHFARRAQVESDAPICPASIVPLIDSM
jgi:hypothetical protein